MQAQPLFDHDYSIKRSKVSKSYCRSGKRDSGECIKLTSMTPGNTEYPKYNPPGAQNSRDALAKVSSVHSFLSAKP